MAHGRDLLTHMKLTAAKPGETLSDGAGLYLRASKKGAGRWSFRFKLRGMRQREMGLGAFPAVSLKEARDLAAAARAQIVRGLDPIEEREREAQARAEAVAAAEAAAKATAYTFGDYFEGVFLPFILPTLKSAKHRSTWGAQVRNRATAIWGKTMADISTADVLALLRAGWDAQPDTMNRIRGRIEAAFDHASQNGAFAGANPARWQNFNLTLSPPKRTGAHFVPMPRADLPAFVKLLRAKQSAGTGALALELVILTALRSGEVREARWGEVDWQGRVWTIPAPRMKMKRPHQVPLTPRMLALLQEAWRRAQAAKGAEPGPGDLIFPGTKPGRPLSDATMLKALRDNTPAEAGFHVHGFRSTFRDWAGSETEFPRDLAEEALAHKLGTVEASYRREQAVARRRVMMEAWEAFCDGHAPDAGTRGAGSNVVRFPAGGAAGGAA